MSPSISKGVVSQFEGEMDAVNKPCPGLSEKLEEQEGGGGANLLS